MDFDSILDKLLLETNTARMMPAQYYGKIQNLRQYYKGNMFKDTIKTRQGVAAFENLAKDLMERENNNQKLKWSFALHLAADEQAILLGQNGLLTTEDTEFHETLPNRCQKYSVIRGRVTEIYQFGGSNAEEIIQQLLIDDGLASRKRRNTILDPLYRYIGIGCSYHQSQKLVTVIILAEDVLNLVAPGNEGKLLKKVPRQQGQQFCYEILQEKKNQPRKRVMKENIQHKRQQNIQQRERNMQQSHSGMNFILDEHVNYQQSQYQPNQYQKNQYTSNQYLPNQYRSQSPQKTPILKSKKEQSSCLIF